MNHNFSSNIKRDIRFPKNLLQGDDSTWTMLPTPTVHDKFSDADILTPTWRYDKIIGNRYFDATIIERRQQIRIKRRQTVLC